MRRASGFGARRAAMVVDELVISPRLVYPASPFRVRTIVVTGFCAVVAATVVACRAARPSEAPTAALAKTRSAQDVFRPLRQRFVSGAPSDRARLEPNLSWFVASYPNDGLTPLAKVYLAFIAIDRGDAERASLLVQEIATGPTGSTRDLAELVVARSLLHRGDSAQAFDKLLPLVGKLIDVYARLLLDESIVKAAIGAHRWYEAIAYMDLWLRDGQEDETEVVRLQVRTSLEAIPQDALETMLKAMQDEGSRSGYGKEIRKVVVARLATVAIAEQNTELARRLVETTDDQALGDAAEGLEELASSGGTPTIDGRTIGLLVSTGKSLLGVRAADVLAGVVDALRLTGAGPSDRVKLTTRDERDPKRTELALLSLASHGASILIAGFDPPQADVAARFAVRAHIPVLLLSPLSDGKPPAPPAFLLGVESDAAVPQLIAALAASGARAVAPVGRPMSESAQPSLSFLEEGSCTAPVPQAGESRFPLSSWRKGKLDGLLLLGDGACAADVIGDVASLNLGRVRAAAGLDAADIAAEPGPLPLAVATTGRFPLISGQNSSPLAGFQERHGRAPSWFSAVGHDAAVLARAALRPLPDEHVEEGVEVAKRQQLLEASVRSVSADLWTSEARGFGGTYVLPREIRVTEVKRSAEVK